jgi:hypothetical protein
MKPLFFRGGVGVGHVTRPTVPTPCAPLKGRGE